jgi:hypothetical protein
MATPSLHGLVALAAKSPSFLPALQWLANNLQSTPYVLSRVFHTLFQTPFWYFVLEYPRCIP